MKKYRGKHLRITKAKGFRVGFGYIPHYQSNLDISVDRAQSLMIWCGPYIIAWDYRKRGYKPRPLDDPQRIKSLIDAKNSISEELAAVWRIGYAKRDAQKRAERARIHPDVHRQWQAESDAVKLREMEQNNE